MVDRKAPGEAVIGVDFGGTSIGLGLVDLTGRLIDRWETPSGLHEGGAAVRQRFVETLSTALLRWPAATQIGLGFKGPMDARTGVSYELVGVEGRVSNWRNVSLPGLVRRAARSVGRDVEYWLENDATVAALGERWLGAARRTENWVFVIVGTGIGVKAFEGGRLMRGEGAAGEFGHTILDPSQTRWRCGCGSENGHFEALASGQSLDQRARYVAELEPNGAVAHLAEAAGVRPRGAHLVAAAKAGDPAATAMVEEAARYLGFGLANIINVFHPRLVVVGGGVAAGVDTGTRDLMLDPARRIALAMALPSLAANCAILPSQLERDTGILGAAYLAARRGDI